MSLVVEKTAGITSLFASSESLQPPQALSLYPAAGSGGIVHVTAYDLEATRPNQAQLGHAMFRIADLPVLTVFRFFNVTQRSTLPLSDMDDRKEILSIDKGLYPRKIKVVLTLSGSDIDCHVTPIGSSPGQAITGSGMINLEWEGYMNVF